MLVWLWYLIQARSKLGWVRYILTHYTETNNLYCSSILGWNRTKARLFVIFFNDQVQVWRSVLHSVAKSTSSRSPPSTIQSSLFNGDGGSSIFALLFIGVGASFCARSTKFWMRSLRFWATSIRGKPIPQIHLREFYVINLLPPRFPIFKRGNCNDSFDYFSDLLSLFSHILNSEFCPRRGQYILTYLPPLTIPYHTIP